MPLVLRCCDIVLVDVWSKTFREYAQFLRRPFQRIPFRSLWHCHQQDWEAAFAEWSALQFWISAFAAVFGQLLLVAVTGLWYLPTAVVYTLIYVTSAYLLAHLGWFAVVKRHGCCIFGVCCCEGPIFVPVWGLSCILLGLARFGESFKMLQEECSLCLLNSVMQGLYALVAIYMGICCLALWQRAPARAREVGAVEEPDVEQQPEAAAPVEDPAPAALAAAPALEVMEAAAATVAEVVGEVAEAAAAGLEAAVGTEQAREQAAPDAEGQKAEANEASPHEATSAEEKDYKLQL